VRTALTSSFVSCLTGGKWWPLGPFLLAPASLVAAGDGVPPCGRRRPVDSRPHPLLLDRGRPDLIRRSRSRDTPSGVNFVKEPPGNY
jgi:hypothetical protein